MNRLMTLAVIALGLGLPSVPANARDHDDRSAGRSYSSGRSGGSVAQSTTCTSAASRTGSSGRAQSGTPTATRWTGTCGAGPACGLRRT